MMAHGRKMCWVVAVLAAVAGGCTTGAGSGSASTGSSGVGGTGNTGTGSGASGSSGVGGSSNSGAGSSAAGSSSVGGTSDTGGGSGPSGSSQAAATVMGTFDVATTLPPLPHLENVMGVVGNDSVVITFLPVDDARDYRVYTLPRDEDVTVQGGQVSVRNAVYRCSGNREVPEVEVDDGPQVGSATGTRTHVDGQNVGGYTRSLAEATLGHVFFAPGPGRVPVYALGDPDPRADNWAFVARVKASRTKQYTTSTDERSTLLAAGWRDDGVVFYVPAETGSGTRAVYTSLDDDGHSRYYFTDGPERDMRSAPVLTFQVLAQAVAETQPLYRVHYTKYQAFSHDELVYGRTMLERVRYQGSTQPMTELRWSGVSGPTTLVVEALASGCPYPGRLAAAAIPAATVEGVTVSGFVDYPEAITPEQAQAADPNGELFINGQYTTTLAPQAVARAFLQVQPQPAELFDWSANFTPGTQPAQFMEVDCGTPSGNCFQQWREVSSEYDLNWHTIVTGQRAMGIRFGELWVRYADWAADTNGKFRLTPVQKATVSAGSFLHATMEVNSITTGRRYPQLLISDRNAPIQDFLPQGNTILMQTFRNWPTFLEVQICDHRTWDVNNQCPFFQFYEQKNAALLTYAWVGKWS